MRAVQPANHRPCRPTHTESSLQLRPALPIRCGGGQIPSGVWESFSRTLSGWIGALRALVGEVCTVARELILQLVELTGERIASETAFSADAQGATEDWPSPAQTGEVPNSTRGSKGFRTRAPWATTSPCIGGRTAVAVRGRTPSWMFERRDFFHDEPTILRKRCVTSVRCATGQPHSLRAGTRLSAQLEAHDRVQRHAVFLQVLRGAFQRQLICQAYGHARCGLPAKPESGGEEIATSDIGGP